MVQYGMVRYGMIKRNKFKTIEILKKLKYNFNKKLILFLTKNIILLKLDYMPHLSNLLQQKPAVIIGYDQKEFIRNRNWISKTQFWFLSTRTGFSNFDFNAGKTGNRFVKMECFNRKSGRNNHNLCMIDIKFFERQF